MQEISNGFTLPLRVVYRPSRRVFALDIAAHVGALACVPAAHLPYQLIAPFLCLLLVASAVREVRRFLCASANPESLHLDAQDSWWLLASGSVPRKVLLRPAAFVHSQLVVLRFSVSGGGRRTFLLCPDNVDPDTLRRLRVRMRFSGCVATMMSGGDA